MTYDWNSSCISEHFRLTTCFKASLMILSLEVMRSYRIVILSVRASLGHFLPLEFSVYTRWWTWALPSLPLPDSCGFTGFCSEVMWVQAPHSHPGQIWGSDFSWVPFSTWSLWRASQSGPALPGFRLSVPLPTFCCV